MSRYIKKNPFAVLSPEEKGQLRAMLESPVFQKMLSIITCAKPSSNCALAGSGNRDAFSGERATARLGEMRGWELYETALFAAINTPEEISKFVEESFPDSGLPGFDNREPPAPKKVKKS